MTYVSRPYFWYDDPTMQGRVYDTTGLGSWWRGILDSSGYREEYLGRDKPRDAE